MLESCVGSGCYNLSYVVFLQAKFYFEFIILMCVIFDQS